MVEAVGTWGARWIGVLGDEDLDPKLLLWDMHRNVDRAAVPTPRAVLHFRFPEVRGAQGRWWLVITPQEVDVCDEDPGHEVTLTLTSSLRDLTQVWRGDLTWAEAVGSGRLEVTGPERLRRDVPSWFALSSFADVPRGGSLVTV